MVYKKEERIDATKSTSNESIKQIYNGNEGNVREEVVDNYWWFIVLDKLIYNKIKSYN